MKDADTALQYALTMFPSALLPLLDKCSIEADPRAATHSFFLEGHGSKGLEVLVGLYVQRSHHIWKDPVLLPWLERNVNAVLDAVAANSEFVKDCATKRKSRYQVGTNRTNSSKILFEHFKSSTRQLCLNYFTNTMFYSSMFTHLYKWY